MTSSEPTDYPRPLPGSPSGLKVLIAGAGIGGLSCAIESRLEGHEVIVLEQTAVFRALGDNIGLFPNSGRFIKRWGIHHELSKHCAYPDGLTILKYDGEVIVNQNHKKEKKTEGPDPFKEAPLYDTTRSGLHAVLLARARELGAEVS